MLRITTFLITTLIACNLLADAAIFSGSDVKILKDNLDLNGKSKILSGTTDPSSTATSAPIGSLYLNSTNGVLYRKLNAGSSTSWIKIDSFTAKSGNLLTYNDWESVTTGWTASGGTYTRVSSAGGANTANIGSGIGAASFDGSSAAQTLTSTAVTIPPGSFGKAGIVSCNFQGTGATHLLQAWDGASVLATKTITSAAAYNRTSVSFIFPSSGTISLRIKTVASNEPIIYIDDCYLGLSQDSPISTVSELWATGSTGYGSTNNKIPLWGTIRRNACSDSTGAGCDIYWQQDSVNGSWVTIQTDGIYTASVSYGYSGSDGTRGISLNSSTLTTSIASLTEAEIVCQTYEGVNGGMASCSATGYFVAGDVIRPHMTGSAVANSNPYFRVVKVSK